jgi:tetratricopeptide (TPR) repeat protein
MDKRKSEATRIWREIVAAHPKDAVAVAKTADLFRQANINDEAIALYKQAIELAPAEPQYREYLGEFYHVLKRPDDALATWKPIAEGPRHTAANVARLAEVFNSFGYADQAIAAIAEACQLDPKDFSLQLMAAEYHGRAQKYDEALKFIDAAQKLAANDDERESVIKGRIEVLQSSRRLEDETESLAAKLSQNEAAGAEEWHVLARYYEADRRWSDATHAVERALAKTSRSSRSWPPRRESPNCRATLRRPRRQTGNWRKPTGARAATI